MDTELGAYKLDPQQGEALWFFGGLATFKASSEQTGGRFSITEQTYPGGMATPLHVQPEDDETFYVLEGDLTFYLEDGQPLAASAGSFVHLPAGTAHAYRVDSQTARLLNITTTAARGLLPRGGRSGAGANPPPAGPAGHGQGYGRGGRARGRDPGPPTRRPGLGPVRTRLIHHTP